MKKNDHLITRQSGFPWVASFVILVGLCMIAPISLWAVGTQKVITEVDSPPAPRKDIRVKYTRELRKENASITLRFKVSVDGNVEQITIVKFSSPDLIDPALDAYGKARFNPAMKSGTPVECWVEYEEKAHAD